HNRGTHHRPRTKPVIWATLAAGSVRPGDPRRVLLRQYPGLVPRTPQANPRQSNRCVRVLHRALHIPVSPALSTIGIMVALVIIMTLWTQAAYFLTNPSDRDNAAPGAE